MFCPNRLNAVSSSESQKTHSLPWIGACPAVGRYAALSIWIAYPRAVLCFFAFFGHVLLWKVFYCAFKQGGTAEVALRSLLFNVLQQTVMFAAPRGASQDWKLSIVTRNIRNARVWKMGRQKKKKKSERASEREREREREWMRMAPTGGGGA